MSQTLGNIQNLRDNLSVIKPLDSVKVCEDFINQIKYYLRNVVVISR